MLSNATPTPAPTPNPNPTPNQAARMLLGCANVAGVAAVRRATRRQFGPLAGKAFVVLACCQFHGSPSPSPNPNPKP